MEDNLINEVSNSQTSTLHSNTLETEVTTSVSPTTKDYTPNVTQNEDTSNNSSSTPKIPHFFDSRGDFKHTLFAQFAHIQRINGTNHIYKGSTTGIYVCDNELIEFALQQLVRPRFNFTKMKEEVKHLNIATKMSEVSECPSNYVGLMNGVYNIDTSEFKEFTSCTPTEFILTNKLSVDHAAKVPTSNKVVDKLFKDITGSDAGLELFLYEVLGSCFCRCSLPLAFVLTGDSSTNGNDGRDIFLDIIRAIAGECASFDSLQELITAKTFHSLYTKTCNISNEQYKTKMLNINKLVGFIRGNKVLPTKEFGGLTFSPYTTLLFNVRDILDFEGVFSDLGEYFKVIPFKNQLNVDKSMADTILAPENLQYITFKALGAFAKVLQCDKFSIPTVVEQATSKYLLDNNSAREFCSTNPIFHIERKFDYYMQYREWCDNNNKVAVGNSLFGKEVIKYGYLPARFSIGGGRRPCYYKVKDFDVQKLFEQYASTIEANTPEILRPDGTFAEGRFIEAFIDFFHSNTLEDMNEKSLTEQADVNARIEEALKDLPVTM